MYCKYYLNLFGLNLMLLQSIICLKKRFFFHTALYSQALLTHSLTVSSKELLAAFLLSSSPIWYVQSFMPPRYHYEFQIRQLETSKNYFVTQLDRTMQNLFASNAKIVLQSLKPEGTIRLFSPVCDKPLHFTHMPFYYGQEEKRTAAYQSLSGGSLPCFGANDQLRFVHRGRVEVFVFVVYCRVWEA